MIPELSNKYSWWQVGIVTVSFTVYHKSNVCTALMYIQQRHMVFSELHIYHDLVLDQKVNDNAYSTPLIHEALDMEQKMLMLVIGLYQYKFTHPCVEHQHYPENDTLCLSILFYSLFSYIYMINDSMFTMLLRQIFWDFLARLTSLFSMQ